MTEKPLDLIHDSLDKDVLVKLKSKEDFRGTLSGYDTHLNLVLKDAQKIINGEIQENYDKFIIRGDNILFVSPAEE